MLTQGMKEMDTLGLERDPLRDFEAHVNKDRVKRVMKEGAIHLYGTSERTSNHCQI
jgi:hypothetical protein